MPEWTQRRRRRSMEHGDTGPPPRQRSGRLVPLMRSVAHTATRPPSQGPASALRYNYRGGTAEKRFSAGEIVHVQKNPKEPIFWSGQLESTWRGAVAGGTLIFTHIDGCGFEPRHARSFLFVGFWCFGAQDAARANRRVVRGCTGKSCEFRGWPRFAFFCDFSDAHFAVYGARRALRSKTWVSATLHRQGPRMVSEARNVCFGITGARNRPIPTLLPSET